ncbi:MAG TPA: hypothetical protein PLF22_09770 [Pseudomonadales bacterium]|nr:hypothetical protein [Pseudomonadales bacterium]
MNTRAAADFLPVLRTAIAEARAAGLQCDALEARVTACYTTSSEFLGECGLAIEAFKNENRTTLPYTTTKKLDNCLQEISKVFPRFHPWHAHLREYTRPWKLFTLGIGLALLIAGSFYMPAPDWDIPISFIMALFAYLTASWSLHVLAERRWRYFPLMLFYTWFTVDGCYWIYWHFTNPQALELMRSANFLASLSLYWMCGLVWYYPGSLRQFVSETRRSLQI